MGEVCFLLWGKSCRGGLGEGGQSVVFRYFTS